MKPGDIVTWNYQSPTMNTRREANHGPGPYQLHSCHVAHTFSGKEMPCWRLKRLRDGYRLPNIMIFEKNLKICTFLNEARKAIESKGETHATNEGL